MLIQNDDQNNSDIGKAALDAAVKNEDVEIIQQILKHSIDVNKKSVNRQNIYSQCRSDGRSQNT